MYTLFADTVLLSGRIGDWHFALMLSTLIYFVIAALIGLAAEFIVGWRLPFGFLGALIAALVGIWLFTSVIPLTIAGDPVFYGVPLVKTLIGAIVFLALWHLITAPAWHRRPRYVYRRRRYVEP